jgi:hypothetical protein
MNSLTLPKVAENAPAAAPRKNAKDEKLLDTHAFLRHVRSAYDMSEVGVAVQGRRHEDSKKAKARDGRHLVAASRPDGLTFFLLNSHFKDRRAHIGVGVQRDGSFLIGPSLTVQRWKGYEEPVKLLAVHFTNVMRAVKGFEKLKLTDREVNSVAASMSRKGYISTVESRPAAKALIDGLYSNRALDVGFYIIGRMRSGNLEAIDGGRRIKRVRRPDGLFHAGMIAFDLLLGFAHEHHAVAASVSFGDLKERLIRP